ncbi:unnamed protein product [Peniophora sp. CBMAI 1063]|nr:unnamed protein product [Peniophora sp. CBMAI 1063]
MSDKSGLPELLFLDLSLVEARSFDDVNWSQRANVKARIVAAYDAVHACIRLSLSQELLLAVRRIRRAKEGREGVSEDEGEDEDEGGYTNREYENLMDRNVLQWSPKYRAVVL